MSGQIPTSGAINTNSASFIGVHDLLQQNNQTNMAKDVYESEQEPTFTNQNDQEITREVTENYSNDYNF